MQADRSSVLLCLLATRGKSCSPTRFGVARIRLINATSRQASFERAKTWVQTLRRQADPAITIILVGNKSDMAESSRRTPREVAEQYAEEEGLLFVEASAKTGENVQDVFMQVVSRQISESAVTGRSRGAYSMDNTAGQEAAACTSHPGRFRWQARSERSQAGSRPGLSAGYASV